MTRTGRNSGLPRIAPEVLKPRAKSQEPEPLFSSPSPNPALKGTRGYALVFFPYSARPRPLARALGGCASFRFANPKCRRGNNENADCKKRLDAILD